MANDFTIRTEEINSTAKKLDQKIQEWDTAVKAIYTVYENLNSMFEGEAKASFAARMANDKPKYTELNKILQEYANALPKAVDTYVIADNEAAKAINGR